MNLILYLAACVCNTFFCSSHMFVTYVCHTFLSHIFVKYYIWQCVSATLFFCSSHMYVTYVRHTCLSHIFVKYVCHICLSHMFVTNFFVHSYTKKSASLKLWRTSSALPPKCVLNVCDEHMWRTYVTNICDKHMWRTYVINICDEQMYLSNKNRIISKVVTNISLCIEHLTNWATAHAI